MRRRAATACLGVLLASAGGCRIQEIPRPERVDLNEVAREDIRVTLEAWRDALLRGDAEALARLHTGDAVLWRPGEPDVIGSRAIAGAMADQLRTRPVSALTIHRESLHVIEGGVAYEMGTFTESVGPDTRPVHLNGRYAIRWRRQPEAEWRIERFLFNFTDLAGADSAAH